MSMRDLQEKLDRKRDRIESEFAIQELFYEFAPEFDDESKPYLVPTSVYCHVRNLGMSSSCDMAIDFGGYLGVDSNYVTPDQVAEIMDVWTPVPMVRLKYGSTTAFLYEHALAKGRGGERLKHNYETGEVSQVLPFTVRFADSTNGQVFKVSWYTVVSITKAKNAEILVQCDAYIDPRKQDYISKIAGTHKRDLKGYILPYNWRLSTSFGGAKILRRAFDYSNRRAYWGESEFYWPREDFQDGTSLRDIFFLYE